MDSLTIGQTVYLPRGSTLFGIERWEKVTVIQDMGKRVRISRWNSRWGRLQALTVMRRRISVEPQGFAALIHKQDEQQEADSAATNTA